MELLFELFLTVSLSLIFTSLFIKLSSMSPDAVNNITDNNKDDDDHQLFTEEALQIDKFQWVPFKEEVIKLQECPDEGKSMVEFYSVSGVELENKVGDVGAVDSKKDDDHQSNDHQSDHHDQDVWFGSSEENDELGDGKMCEIEIESAEEEEEEVKEVDGQCGVEKHDDVDDHDENEMMNDWEEIGIKDFEEFIGTHNRKIDNNKAESLYEYDVLIHGK